MNWRGHQTVTLFRYIYPFLQRYVTPSFGVQSWSTFHNRRLVESVTHPQQRRFTSQASVPTHLQFPWCQDFTIEKSTARPISYQLNLSPSGTSIWCFGPTFSYTPTSAINSLNHQHRQTLTSSSMYRYIMLKDSWMITFNNVKFYTCNNILTYLKLYHWNIAVLDISSLQAPLVPLIQNSSVLNAPSKKRIRDATSSRRNWQGIDNLWLFY